MSGLLAVGDMHLKETMILPLVDKALENLEVDTIVLMGDYLDEWGQNNNANRYREQMDYLVKWVKSKRQSMNVVCLLGNHDIPYITRNFRHYSSSLPDVSEDMYKLVQALEPQLYYRYEEWLFTHAGAAGEGKLPFDEFDQLQIGTWETKGLLHDLETSIGVERGGSAKYGSIVWADYNYTLLNNFNKNYPKQIVGHTPVSTIDDWHNIIDIDTFSLTMAGNPIGDGSLLYIDGDKPKVIHTDYKNKIKKLGRNSF